MTDKVGTASGRIRIWHRETMVRQMNLNANTTCSMIIACIGRTEPPLPKEKKIPAKPKANSKKAQAAKRKATRSKRRKTEEPEETPEVEEEETIEAQAVVTNGEAQETPTSADINTLGGYKWECVAITPHRLPELYRQSQEAQRPERKDPPKTTHRRSPPNHRSSRRQATSKDRTS